MKVLVIPENPTYNGYILKPLVKRLLQSVGKPQAQVNVLLDPFAQGYPMIKAELPAIYERYHYLDLLLFLPDDDCCDRTAELRNIEHEAEQTGVNLIACAAIPEVEAWLLAGHVDKLPANWQTVRTDCELKERYFEPFLQQYGDRGVGGGRQQLMQAALLHFTGILSRCPELKTLQQRMREVLEREA
ncbi:MAG: hypothetical protein HY870_08670 [Chloroflexi bacterium]|nr:hypothetical protein [Chloroflexota bacterium]